MGRFGALLMSALLASASAQAAELQPIQGATVTVGGVAGVVYYTIEPDGYRAVATVASGAEAPPVRFVAVLTDGQKLWVSVPGPVGSPASEIEIARSGNRLSITDRPVLVAIEE